MTTARSSQNCGKVLVALTGQGPPREEGLALRRGRAQPPPTPTLQAWAGVQHSVGDRPSRRVWGKRRKGRWLSSNTPTPLDGLICPWQLPHCH